MDVHARSRVRGSAAVSALAVGSYSASAPGGAEGPGAAKGRPGWRSPPCAAAAAFSPDGKRLAAASHAPAVDRPGTDWDAFVVVWELAGGERREVRDACTPLAWSPGGRVLAAGR